MGQGAKAKKPQKQAEASCVRQEIYAREIFEVISDQDLKIGCLNNVESCISCPSLV